MFKLFISSIDIIHSFSLLAIGIKVDCIPNRIVCTSLISLLNNLYYDQCSELCNSLHGFMPIKLLFI